MYCNINGNTISMVVSINANTEPAGLAFQIHQVVPTLKIKKVRNPYKKAHPACRWFSTNNFCVKNKGTKAMANKGKKLIGYHDNTNSTPLSSDSPKSLE